MEQKGGFFTNLTWPGRILLAGAVVFVCYLIYTYGSGPINRVYDRWVAPKGKQVTQEIPKEVKQAAKEQKMETLNVALNVWPGNIPGIYYNGGLVPSASSRYFKDGIIVKFTITDEFKAMRDGWKAGEYDIMGLTTVDALPTEIADVMALKPKAPIAIDKSRGGDVAVVAPGVKSAQDLLNNGWKIAYAGQTPSQTLAMLWFEASGVSYAEMKAKGLLVETDSALAAASQFKSGAVKAAVMWSPDDGECIKAVPGSRRIFSTKTAGEAIIDIVLVKEDVSIKKKEAIKKFVRGWLLACAEINNNPKAKEEAAKLIMSTMNVTTMEDAYAMIDNARLMTYGDNLRFFGLKGGTGVSGEEVWNKMAKLFYQAGAAPKEVPPWRNIADVSVINSLNPAEFSGPEHAAEGAPKFTPPTEADKTAVAFAEKPVSVQFAFGSAELTEDGKIAIETYVTNQVKEFSGARMRIEGNTDNIGSADYNDKLSYSRAKSVARVFTSKGFDPNKFVVMGNGFRKPVKGCESNATDECRAKNRRTEFALIGKE